MFDTFAWVAIRSYARLAVARRVRLRVEGAQYLPREGPALIASRHYHHLYDALVLLTAVPRPAHFLVALDWVADRRGRRVMEALCRWARWPVVLRAEELARQAQRAAGPAAYSPTEAQPYLRRGLAEGVALLRQGRVLVVFPEAYPNVDPDYTPKRGEALLPFRSGFARLAARAAREGDGVPVPVLPTGLAYRRLPDQSPRPPGRRGRSRAHWDVTLRFGPPVLLAGARKADLGEVVQEVERAVRTLSRPAPPLPPPAGAPAARGRTERRTA